MYRFQNISKIHCCWQSQNHLFVVCLRIFNLLWLLFSDVGFCRITLKKDWGWVWSAGFWWFWVCLKKWCFQQQHLLILYSCTEWWFDNRPESTNCVAQNKKNNKLYGGFPPCTSTSQQVLLCATPNWNTNEHKKLCCLLLVDEIPSTKSPPPPCLLLDTITSPSTKHSKSDIVYRTCFSVSKNLRKKCVNRDKKICVKSA